MAELFGVKNTPTELLLSEKAPNDAIRTYLRGSNSRITSNAAFKKSTPPGQGSHIISVTNPDDWFMQTFSRPVTDTLPLGNVKSLPAHELLARRNIIR